MVCGMDSPYTVITMSMMLVRRITMIVLLIGAPLLTYCIGQWIDGDNLFVGQTLKQFWQFQIRQCPAC